MNEFELSIKKRGFTCLNCHEYVKPREAILLYKLNYRLLCRLCEAKQTLKEAQNLGMRGDSNDY